MASEITQNPLRGLIVQDPRINKDSLWAAQSSYSQAGPTAGVPVAQQATDMVLTATGDQSADGQLRVRAIRPGHPGTAGFAWTNEGESLWRGWDVPSAISGWEAIDWHDGSGTYTTQDIHSYHMLALKNGVVLCAFHRETTIVDQLRVGARATDGTWSYVNVVSGSNIITSPNYNPCLLELPTGRVLIYFWQEDDNADEAQLRMYYSDDDGATWTIGAKNCLSTPIAINSTNGYTPKRTRAAYANGQVLLVAHLTDNDSVASTNYLDVLLQCASSDYGATFSTIYQGDGATQGTLGGYHDIIVYDNRFYLFYLGTDGGGNSVFLAQLDSAYTSYQDVSPVDIESSLSDSHSWYTDSGATPYYTMTDGDLAAVVDDTGKFWVYGRRVASTSEGTLLLSEDNGESFAYVGQSSVSATQGYWFESNDSATYLQNFNACWHRGRVLLAHQWAANPGNEDTSLGLVYLGGYATVTMPPFLEGYDLKRRVNWDTNWLPIEEAGDVTGWTATGAGTDTLASPGYMSVVTTAGQSRYYDANPGGTIAGGMIVRTRLQVNSGGSLTSLQLGLRLRLADSTDDYDVVIRFTTGGFRIYDNNAAADIDTIAVSTTAGIELLIAMADDNFRLWYRIPDTGTDRQWIFGASDNSLTSDTSTPDSNNLIRWGHVIASAADSDWFEMHYVSEDSASLTGYETEQLAAGQANPEEVNPKPFGAAPVYVDDNVAIAAIDGPAYINDEWDIDTRYRYGIENIFPAVEPSPRRGWRNLADGSEQTIALTLDSTFSTTDTSYPGNDVIGVALFGVNFRSCYLEGYDVGGASWTSLVQMRANGVLGSLDWVREGNTFRPDGNDGDIYIHFNEYAGGTFQVGATGPYLPVVTNTAGKWTNVGGQKAPTLITTGATGATSTSGGSGALWAPQMCGLVFLNGANYSAYRLRIDSQDTADGYFKIGTMVIGWVEFFGSENSWGRAVETSGGAELEEARDRTSRSRVVAPPQRTLDLAWTDGIDQTQIEVDVNDPDYIEASTDANAEPVATPADTAYQLEGLVRFMNGSDGLFVYLPRVDKDTGDGYLRLSRRHELMLARMTSNVRVENIQGDELSDEVVRVATVTGTEVV